MKDNYHKQSRRNFLNRTLMEVTGDMVVSTKPHPEVLRRSVEAALALENQNSD